MNNKVTIVKPGSDKKAVFGAGDEYYYLATGKETDGQYFLFESIVPPGGGPPPHAQSREEEAFYILEGEVTFYAEGKEILATPGTYLNIPKGVIHRFRNNSDKNAKMLVFFAPAGIEKMFEEMGANEHTYIKHPMGVIAALNEAGNKYGVTFYEEDEKVG